MPHGYTITANVLADLFGISPRSIIDLAKRDIIERSGSGYALIASVQGYTAHLRKLAQRRGGESDIVTAQAARSRLASEQADGVALKNQRLRGALLDAGAVEAEWSGIMRTVRAGMLAVSSRCQQRLPSLSAHDVSEIDREVRAALTEVGTD